MPPPFLVDKLEIESLYKQFQVLADLPVDGGSISRAAFQYCLGPFGMVDTALADSIFKVWERKGKGGGDKPRRGRKRADARGGASNSAGAAAA